MKNLPNKISPTKKEPAMQWLKEVSEVHPRISGYMSKDPLRFWTRYSIKWDGEWFSSHLFLYIEADTWSRIIADLYEQIRKYEQDKGK